MLAHIAAVLSWSLTLGFSVVLKCSTQYTIQDPAINLSHIVNKLHFCKVVPYSTFRIANIRWTHHDYLLENRNRKMEDTLLVMLPYAFLCTLYYTSMENLEKVPWFSGTGSICSHRQTARSHTTLHIGSHHSSTHLLQAQHSTFFVSPVIHSKPVWEILQSKSITPIHPANGQRTRPPCPCTRPHDLCNMVHTATAHKCRLNLLHAHMFGTNSAMHCELWFLGLEV